MDEDDDGPVVVLAGADVVASVALPVPPLPPVLQERQALATLGVRLEGGIFSAAGGAAAEAAARREAARDAAREVARGARRVPAAGTARGARLADAARLAVDILFPVVGWLSDAGVTRERASRGGRGMEKGEEETRKSLDD